MNEFRYIFTLGSNSALSAAEIHAALNHSRIDYKLLSATSSRIVLRTDKELPGGLIARLGGTIDIALVLDEYPKMPSADDLLALLTSLPNRQAGPPDKKITFAISSPHLKGQETKKLSTNLKKLIKAQNGSAGFVLPKNGSTLNSAQLLFNDLLDENNTAFTIIAHDEKYLVGRINQAQDIQAYQARDDDRPVRDAKVGMLPPKLAQIMINLATSTILPTPDSLLTGITIYDPFCGLGTILQEGHLMGHTIFGSDISDKNVAGTVENLEYMEAREAEVFVHDATVPFPTELKGQVDAIITEVTLGPAMRDVYKPKEAREKLAELSRIYLQFLKNAKEMLSDHGTILLALPQLKTNQEMVKLPQSWLDQVEKLGYSTEQLVPDTLKEYFKDSGRDSLIYARPGAFVARELFKWRKK